MGQTITKRLVLYLVIVVAFLVHQVETSTSGQSTPYPCDLSAPNVTHWSWGANTSLGTESIYITILLF